MATRNLSRSAIEGGRSTVSKRERRAINRCNRQNAKRTLRTATDPEDLDVVDQPHRGWFYREFSDTLNAVYRWLDAQRGRPWNDVKSDLRRRYDVRSLKAHHMIFDHVETESVVCPIWHAKNMRESNSISRGSRYVVDENGIFRDNPYHRTYRSPKPAVKLTDSIKAWLANRQVGKVGNCLFWFEHSNEDPEATVRCDFHCVAGRDQEVWHHDPLAEQWSVRWTFKTHVHRPRRQTLALGNEDLVFWKQLSDEQRQKILQCSPVNRRKE